MGMDNMQSRSNPQNPNVNPITQASVASLVNSITHFITKISGTEAITGFTLPLGFRGIFCVIPTGAFTGATGGTLARDVSAGTEAIPIGKAFTMVANVAALFVSDGLLVYPVAMTAELID